MYEETLYTGYYFSQKIHVNYQSVDSILSDDVALRIHRRCRIALQMLQETKIMRWSRAEIIILLSFIILNLIIFALSPHDIVSFISLISSICGVIGVLLSIKGKMHTYYFGIVKVMVYAYISYQAALYSEVALNILFYLPMQIIGLYAWHRHQQHDTVIVRRLSMSQGIRLIIITTLSTVVYTLIINHLHLNTTGIDALPVILAVTGQILMVRRFMEQWICWTLLNIVSIILWIIAGGNPLIILMYSVMLINSTYGYYNWKQLIKQQ